MLCRCIGVCLLLRITPSTPLAIWTPLDAISLSLSPKQNSEVDDSIDMPWHVSVSTPCCLKAKQMILFLSFSFLCWVTSECDFSLPLLMFSFNTQRGERGKFEQCTSPAFRFAAGVIKVRCELFYPACHQQPVCCIVKSESAFASGTLIVSY